MADCEGIKEAKADSMGVSGLGTVPELRQRTCQSIKYTYTLFRAVGSWTDYKPEISKPYLCIAKEKT
jgi:hypothetical protein